MMIFFTSVSIAFYSLNIITVGSMGDELQMAYRKGLPYPMLKLLEYFSLNEGSFDWGRKYRLAGHYAGASLWYRTFPKLFRI